MKYEIQMLQSSNSKEIFLEIVQFFDLKMTHRKYGWTVTFKPRDLFRWNIFICTNTANLLKLAIFYRISSVQIHNMKNGNDLMHTLAYCLVSSEKN